MKLHLPSRLRKALLACLAAMAMPALSATVASGSSLIGGGALVSFILGQQATAADDETELPGVDIDVEEVAGEADNLISGALEDDADTLTLEQLAALAAADGVFGDAGLTPYTGGGMILLRLLTVLGLIRWLRMAGAERREARKCLIWIRRQTRQSPRLFGGKKKTL